MGAGVSYVSKDKDGYPVFDLPGNENAINKLIKIYDTFMQDEIYKGNQSDNVDANGGTGSFDDGEALFQANNLMGLEGKRKLEIDIGFIPVRSTTRVRRDITRRRSELRSRYC